jgi:hypothetical protein
LWSWSRSLFDASALPPLRSMANPALKWLLAFVVLMIFIAPIAADPEISIGRTGTS